jgi:hypothetical protein
MVGRGALIVLAAALLGACAKPAAPLAVPQLIAQIHVLNGRTVRVAGYLGTCLGGDCNLFVDRVGYNAELRWRDELKARSGGLAHGEQSTALPTRPPQIGIGGKAEFARKAAPFENSMVVVTGKVTDRCRGPDGQPGCADASTDIEPTDIASPKDQ